MGNEDEIIATIHAAKTEEELAADSHPDHGCILPSRRSRRRRKRVFLPKKVPKQLLLPRSRKRNSPALSINTAPMGGI